MATIYQLQITSDYNISACHSATSATVDYKNTLSQYISFKLHPTTIFQLAIQQPQQLSTTRRLQEHIITIYQLQNTSNYNISACHSATSATVNYKNTLSQYISFKLHPTTIFQPAIQKPQQLSTTSQLQEHIITIHQLQITSNYNISACHSATSATVDYKNTLSQYNTFKLPFNKALTISKVLVCRWDFRNFTYMVPQQYCNGILTCYPETSHQWTFQLCLQISAMFLWHMYRHHGE